MGNEELIKQCTEKAMNWLTPAYDAETQAEVKRMLENPDKTELIEAFYKDLEFGTGGLRGIMGVGSNRMNIYTVGVATQGLSNYLNKCFAGKKDISVVVGHDCRNNSRLFAEISANIFSANGIKVYLFEDMRPTPEMSFAIRHLGCQSGIILTASHNPKEYNGYKAYWDDGAQVLAPHDKGIIDEVNKVASAKDIKFEGNKDLIQIIGKEVDDEYLRQVHSISIDPEVIKRQKDLKIVYTPIHGTGMMLIPQSLKLWGFENVHCVPEQMVKSGDFPTVVSPNPENAEALTLAIKLAKEIDADIVMASDPDADRVGMACKDSKGEWVLINGNQTCLLFLYYIIKNRIAMGNCVRIIPFRHGKKALDVIPRTSLIVDQHHRNSKRRCFLHCRLRLVQVNKASRCVQPHNIKSPFLQKIHHTGDRRVLRIGGNDTVGCPAFFGINAAEQRRVVCLRAAGGKKQLTGHRAADSQRLRKRRAGFFKQSVCRKSRRMQGRRISVSVHCFRHPCARFVAQCRCCTVIQINQRFCFLGFGFLHDILLPLNGT